MTAMPLASGAPIRHDGSQLVVASDIGIYLYEHKTFKEEAYIGENITSFNLTWSTNQEQVALGNIEEIIII